MAILSLDVGRRNLGVCLLDDDGRILRWTTLDFPSLAAGDVVATLNRMDNSFDLVLVERQPSRNPSMKRLEAFLEMYFAKDGKVVRLVDPRRKLDFAAQSPYWDADAAGGPWTYHRRKKLAVAAAAKFLDAHPQDPEVERAFRDAPKKDDLADSLLQALAFSSSPAPRGAAAAACAATATTCRLVRRKPTPRQLRAATYSPSNLKYLVGDLEDAQATIRAIDADPKLRRSAARHFGSSAKAAAALRAQRDPA